MRGIAYDVEPLCGKGKVNVMRDRPTAFPGSRVDL